MATITTTAALVAAALALAACNQGAPATTATDAGTWKQGAAPRAAAGLTVTVLATGLRHPRAVYPLPNGDILIVESTGPAAPVLRPKDLFREPSGAAGGASGRITLVRPNPDGGAARQTVLLDGLHAPAGVALVGTDLYVANTDALMRYPYNTGDTRITATGKKVIDLPAGPINRYWARSLLASDDGSKLYVGVGASSARGENGMAAEKNRAAILEVERATGAVRTFANGLRNPDAMQWEPHSQAMWKVVDDKLTAVKDGGAYGWPASDKGGPAESTGLGFNNPASTMPDALRDGAFIGQQGSGKVVFVPFVDGKPAGQPVDVVTGFIGGGTAMGRPAGLTMDHRGGLLIADDVGNTVWRVSGPPLK